MRTTLLILFAILLFVPIELIAQNTTQKKTYKVWITLINGSKEKGILYSADKEGVKILNSKSLDVTNLILIGASKIDIIKIRRKGKVGKGVWVGALIGASVGMLAGFAGGDDPPGWFSSTKEEKAIGGGIVLGVLGSGVGALTATSKKKIIINGNIEIYKRQQDILQSYSLTLK